MPGGTMSAHSVGAGAEAHRAAGDVFYCGLPRVSTGDPGQLDSCTRGCGLIFSVGPISGHI